MHSKILNIITIAAPLFLCTSGVPLMGQNAESATLITGDAHPTIRILRRPGDQPFSSAIQGLQPSQVRHAYGFDLIANQGAGQTVAIIDAFDNPTAEADLAVFSSQFSLPACSTANGCFQLVYAGGSKPPTNPSWALESALDTQWVHAIAPQAKIILVESADNSNVALYKAVQVAVQMGAKVISMSWGGSEFSKETAADAYFKAPGVTYVASSGDSGAGTCYPAASPYVVSVGGTSLTLGADGSYTGEVAWSGSGGGVSAYEAQPSYQSGVQSTGFRTVPDVAYDADPYTGVPVYVSSMTPAGWYLVGGTSMGVPQWAALFAIANATRARVGKATLTHTNSYLYTVPASYFNDVTSGTNGSCGANCTAAPGYDMVTGRGTPRANLLITVLTQAR